MTETIESMPTRTDQLQFAQALDIVERRIILERICQLRTELVGPIPGDPSRSNRSSALDALVFTSACYALPVHARELGRHAVPCSGYGHEACTSSIIEVWSTSWPRRCSSQKSNVRTGRPPAARLR